MNSDRIKVVLISFFLCFGTSIISTSHAASVKELSQLSLEEFSKLDVIVTSASRKPQKISDTASAVFVVSNEDIIRSGVTSIPEALRMVPGVQVARIDSNKWAISARGFNGRFANKLLVLIDGRTVYNPMFSGVYWNRQDVMLEDVERIEVIRGPGATLWGANAVNGVINVITKKASDTQGALLTAGGGTEEQGFVNARYGTQFGDNVDARAYIKYFQRDYGENDDGSDGVDDWDNLQGGFRLDWQATPSDAITFQGDIQETGAGTERTTFTLVPPAPSTDSAEVDIDAWNLLGRWQHRFSESSDMELQIYYDTHKRHQTGNLKQVYDTFDVDFQHRFQLGSRQELIWGLGYRNIYDRFLGDFTVSLTPIDDTTELFSAFIQDDISFAHGKIHLIIGSKFEHNDFTGLEIQPNIRLNWNINDQHSFWAAISRAVRTPGRSVDSRINQIVIPGVPSRLVSIFGNPDIGSEKVKAFELGLRGQATDTVKYDLALFYNLYDDLRVFEQGTPTVLFSPVPHVLVPITSQGFMRGETYGLEVALDWKATDWINFKLTYSLLEMQLHKKDASTSTTAENAENESPEQQISLRSSFDINPSFSVDTWLRYVDELPAQDIGAYITLDTRFAWRPIENLELSLIGQNLLNDSETQFEPEILNITSTQVERGFYAKINWQF